MKRAATSWMALACGALLMQMAGAQPKPKSQKEVEALMLVQKAATADERLKAIENVLTSFADTEYKPMLLQMAMQTAEQKNDYAQTTFYADRVLEGEPNNAFALVTLASEIPRHTREFDLDKEEKLSKAEKYANQAIASAKDAPKVRPDLTDEQWNSVKKDLAAQGHEALGMIAVERKKYDVAVTEFKTALDVSSNPDPATMVRLGQAYLDAGKLDEAAAAFDRAAASPNVPDAVKQIAQGKKADIAKKKAGAAPTAQPAPAPKP